VSECERERERERERTQCSPVALFAHGRQKKWTSRNLPLEWSILKAQNLGRLLNYLQWHKGLPGTNTLAYLSGV
jgi:hypothetical protein